MNTSEGGETGGETNNYICAVQVQVQTQINNKSAVCVVV